MTPTDEREPKCWCRRDRAHTHVVYMAPSDIRRRALTLLALSKPVPRLYATAQVRDGRITWSADLLESRNGEPFADHR